MYLCVSENIWYLHSGIFVWNFLFTRPYIGFEVKFNKKKANTTQMVCGVKKIQQQIQKQLYCILMNYKNVFNIFYFVHIETLLSIVRFEALQTNSTEWQKNTHIIECNDAL